MKKLALASIALVLSVVITATSFAAVSITSTYNYRGVIDVNISGGTFTSANGQAVYKYDNPDKPYNNASVSITGGTFSSDPSVYVAEGYKATGGNGTWTVAASN